MDIKSGDVIVYHSIRGEQFHGIIKEATDDGAWSVFWIDKKNLKSGLPPVVTAAGYGSWWSKHDG